MAIPRRNDGTYCVCVCVCVCPNPRQMADDFVARVTAPACAAAKHRKAAMLEVRDLQLVLEKQWGIKIPGVGPQKPPLKVWLADVTNK